MSYECMTCGEPTESLFCSSECRTAGTKGSLEFRARTRTTVRDETAYVRTVEKKREPWREQHELSLG